MEELHVKIKINYYLLVNSNTVIKETIFILKIEKEKGSLSNTFNKAFLNADKLIKIKEGDQALFSITKLEIIEHYKVDSVVNLIKNK